ncbi:MAG: hypothetical protein EOP68_10060, partial [Sphingomonas sp.]
MQPVRLAMFDCDGTLVVEAAVVAHRAEDGAVIGGEALVIGARCQHRDRLRQAQPDDPTDRGAGWRRQAVAIERHFHRAADV